MAEIILKVGTNGKEPQYQDKDIVQAFSQRTIRCDHAYRICHVNNFGMTRDGLRPESLARKFLEHTYEYKYERVSRTEFLRTELSTMQQTIISNIRNAEGLHCYVQLYLDSRLAHPKHRIFGTPGSEFLYHGKKNYSNVKMDLVWNDIETDTVLREVDHFYWRLKSKEKQLHASFQVNDMTDEEEAGLMEPEWNMAMNEDTGEVEKTSLKHKRRCFMDYRSFPTSILTPQEQVDIQIKTREVEVRTNAKQVDRATYVKVKP